MQRIALIPAYCPEDRMITLVRELKELGFSVVVIDDGSGKMYDAVFDRAREYADVRRYQPNRGKGEALKYGLGYIQKHFQPPYSVVTADADGQHRTQDIEKVAALSVQRPESLILGKRLLDKSAPLKSRVGNGITRVLYRMTTGRWIYETQTGLRGFSDRFLPDFLHLPGHRYEYEIDMMLCASDSNIIETEIQTLYFDNNAGSHFRPFEDTVSLNKEFLRYKLPSLIAGAAGYLLFAVWAALTGRWILPCVAAREFAILLKFILNRAIPFSEKPPIIRFLMTSMLILLLEITMMWGLVTIGVNLFAAKLIASFLMIGVSILVRMIVMRFKYKK